MKKTHLVLAAIAALCACHTNKLSISPGSAAPLTGGSTVQFSASGVGGKPVTWSIDGAGSAAGTISSSGLYTSPMQVPYPATITVRAKAAGVSATAPVVVTSPVEDWPKYRRDLANTGRSSETGINAQTAAHLALKWSFKTPGGKVSASPAVAAVNGTPMLFVGAWNGTFYGLNAESGAMVWQFQTDAAPTIGACALSPVDCMRIASSAAVANGNVYFGAGNGFVYCLNAATGTLVWKFQLGNATQGAEVWTSPAVAAGKVYFGTGSHADEPCWPGQIFAFDAATGAVGGVPGPSWTFDVLQGCPAGMSCVGGGVWSSPALDVSFAGAGVNPILYVATGNPGNGCVPASSGTPSTAYTDTVLALDAANGTLLNFYQAYANDPNDAFDFGAAIVLHSTAQCAGTGPSDWLTAANKGGSVFTLGRDKNGLVNGAVSRTELNPLGTGSVYAGEIIGTPVVVPNANACNSIYVPSEYGYLFELNQASDGAVAGVSDATWPLGIDTVKGCTPPAPGDPGSCPMYSAPTSIADVLAFGGGDGDFYVFSASGAKLFDFATPGLVASGPAVSNGRLYFGSFGDSQAGDVYCLSVDGK